MVQLLICKLPNDISINIYNAQFYFKYTCVTLFSCIKSKPHNISHFASKSITLLIVLYNTCAVKFSCLNFTIQNCDWYYLFPGLQFNQYLGILDSFSKSHISFFIFQRFLVKCLWCTCLCYSK